VVEIVRDDHGLVSYFVYRDPRYDTEYKIDASFARILELHAHIEGPGDMSTLTFKINARLVDSG
jgi:hypothetical protein